MGAKKSGRAPVTPKKNGASTKPPVVRLAGEAFPRRSLETAFTIVEALHKNYASKSASSDELASALDMSVGGATFKYTLWASVAYGLVNRNEEGLYSLTETGRKLCAPNYDGEDLEGRVKAVLTPAVLSRFYTDYNGHPLPSDALFSNVLENRYGIPRDRVNEAKVLILANARFAKILVESATGDIARISFSGSGQGGVPVVPVGTPPNGTSCISPEEEVQVGEDWANVCFFITPIGEDASEFRKHADMMLKHLVTPACEDNGLKVVRADKIEKSGLITQQVLEHIVKSRLCVTDLSFRNANVFYELGIRHMTLLPAIQIIKKGDTIPFDVSQGRTIVVDTSDVYTVTDRMDSAKRELSEHIKNSLTSNSRAADDNPIAVYLPGMNVSLPN